MVEFKQMAFAAAELGWVIITLKEHGEEAEVSYDIYDEKRVKFWDLLCKYRDQHSCISYAPIISQMDLCALAQKARVDPSLNEELHSAFVEEEYV